MIETPETKKTVLFDIHESLSAKMAPFGGYLMPIQYEGIIKEHLATRSSAALFDTCHMGEFIVSGTCALDDLENLVTCDLTSLVDGQCRYGFMCNEKGGVIDDLLVYRVNKTRYMMVVNAGTQNADYEWVKSHISSSTQLENQSASTAKIDLQGPDAPRIMQKLISEEIRDMKFFHFKYATYNGREVIVSRTGYTGEVGFEIYCAPEFAGDIWTECMNEGAVPAGLGARDTLRLEIGMPLYGHELDSTRNAAESGFTRSISSSKSYIGSEIILDPLRKRDSLAGFIFEGRRAARHGDVIQTKDEKRVGTVTSGSYSPSLGKAIAIGYIDNILLENHTPVVVCTTRGLLHATTLKPPLYKDGTARNKISRFL